MRCLDVRGEDVEAALRQERLTGEEDVVRIEGHRHVARLVPVDSQGEELRLDGQGWHLVTGAFGGLGSVVLERSTVSKKPEAQPKRIEIR